MSTLNPHRLRRRERVEAVIRVFEPFLNLVLVVGERISRILEPDEPEYAPARMAAEGHSAPRGLRPDRTETAGWHRPRERDPAAAAGDDPRLA